MPSDVRSLTVWFQDERVADLKSDTKGNLELTYREPITARREGEFLLSVSLPVRKDTYPDAQARPFLDGLLPEGRLREQLCQRFRLELSDVFGLLREIGRDCAGAISFIPPEEAIEAGSVAWLSEEDAGRLIEELPLRPLGADPPHGVRMSLAGGQSKVPVVLDAGGQLGLPRGRTPSTHILKPPSSERTGSGRPAYPGLVENEAFCLRLAANCGLTAAQVTVRRFADATVLVVERYDRLRLPSGEATRLHQEDTCQALGIEPGRKYEEQGGPGIADVLDLLRSVSADAGRDVLSFLERTAFNLGIANLDAHGKNIALLYQRGIRLAPMYDLICTAIYPRLSGRLAMSIGGQFQADQVTARHWIALLEQTHLNTVGARRRLAEVGERMMDAVTRTRQEARDDGFNHEALEEVEIVVKERARRLIAIRTQVEGPKLRRAPAALAVRKPSISVDLHARRFEQRVVLDVVNHGKGEEFVAQLLSVEGAEATTLLPLRLRWFQTDTEIAKLLHGETGVVVLGRYHRNGLNYLKNGKWHVEPPFVLREVPSPSGAAVSYIGIYPPTTVRIDDQEAYRFVMRVRVSSSSGYEDRAISIGLSEEQPVEEVTEDLKVARPDPSQGRHLDL